MVKIEKKSVFIVILVVLILFVSGCTTKTTEEPTKVNYRTGTEGLTLSLPASSPQKLYEGDSNVPLVVEVRNKGAFPQEDETKGNTRLDGKIWISGYDDQILTISPVSQSLNDDGELEGKSPYNTDGGYKAYTFTMGVGTDNLPDGMPYYNPTLILTAVYKYKTIASPMICLDPQPRSTKIREKVCTIQESIGLGSQGAPVSVTKVEQDVTSEKFLFKIYVDNEGGGLVIPTTQVSIDPNRGYEWNDLDKVRYEVSVGNEQINRQDCRPRNEVKLIDGKGYIFCTWDIRDEERTYETVLNVELNYGYTTSIEKEIEIFEEVGI